MKTLFQICALLFSQSAFSQFNLVPNCSFEDTLLCPSGWDNLSATPFWYSPTNGSPDYFNSCNSTEVGVPNNVLGFQWANTGNGYAGWLASYDSIDLNSREYLQVQLLSPLVAGQQYYFIANLSKADSAPLALKNIGVALTDSPIGGNYVTPINFSPQIIYSQFLTDTISWFKLTGRLIANGGEQYLTIGYFNYNNSSDTLDLFEADLFHLQAYYFLDDVCVSIDSNKCSCDTTNLIPEFGDELIQVSTISPEILLVDINLQNAYLTLYDMLGRISLTSKIYPGRNEVNAASITNGIYLAIISNGAKIFIRKILLY